MKEQSMGSEPTHSGSMGTRIGKYAGGVEVPVGDRSWTAKLKGSFGRLDINYQIEITNIIKGFGELEKTKAVEIARRIADFFSSLTEGIDGNQKPLSEFIDELTSELEAEKSKKVN